MNNVWIDDLRNPMNFLSHEMQTNLVWLDTYQKGLDYVIENESKITRIHLDNDLSDPDEREGKHLFNEIEFLLHDGLLANLTEIYVHSDNSSAVNNMMSAKDIFKDKYGIQLIRVTYRL